ncbi:hypothetical protein ACXIZN_24605 [Amycolatopsis sp. TRM77291]
MSAIPLAAPVRLRLIAYLTCRQRSWPNIAHPHLFIRYLDEAHASRGDVRCICDLFGLSIAGAYRYTATVDQPGVAGYKTMPQ